MSRLIDAEAITDHEIIDYLGIRYASCLDDVRDMLNDQPTIEAAPVRRGDWILEAHDEKVNYRWNVTAKCSECGFSKGEIWAAFFPGVPKSSAEAVAVYHAEHVEISNFCENCGADMRKGGADSE